jgi:hypothetical protein
MNWLLCIIRLVPVITQSLRKRHNRRGWLNK